MTIASVTQAAPEAAVKPAAKNPNKAAQAIQTSQQENRSGAADQAASSASPEQAAQNPIATAPGQQAGGQVNVYA